jgi:Polyketide cyclase / dehydrase and lipid transport
VPRGDMAAEGVVAAAREDVFAYLARLEHHWQLTDHRVEVVSLDPPSASGDGAPLQRGAVRMRGPLGIGRTARTAVESADPPHGMSGSATLTGGTRARVDWTLSPDGSGTRVRLSAQVESASLLDRALLALGGRTWMQRMFADALERLATVFAERAPASGEAVPGSGATT